MQKKGLELMVGLFVLAGLLALAVLALRIGNLGGVSVSDGYAVTARFDNIGGLKVRSPVKLGGVLIGRVTKIGLDEDDYRALVTMRLAKEYNNLPADSSVAVNTAGLLGEQYLNMEPGGDDEVLKDGDEISITQSALVLEDLIGKFMFNKADEEADK
ncbi:MAG: outer membrane lipid asymmetry maintenance protein MlaD [Gammaproteobacteria bacterium]|nr:MAG: outer membrane lipid asymmetry maintenance protein MlaD [Gammaproteobacteria bacterium]